MVCVVAPREHHLFVFADALSQTLPNHCGGSCVAWNSNCNAVERATLYVRHFCVHQPKHHLRRCSFDFLILLKLRSVLLLTSQLAERVESHRVHEATGRQQESVFNAASNFGNIRWLDLSEGVRVKHRVKVTEELLPFVRDMRVELLPDIEVYLEVLQLVLALDLWRLS